MPWPGGDRRGRRPNDFESVDRTALTESVGILAVERPLHRVVGDVAACFIQLSVASNPALKEARLPQLTRKWRPPMLLHSRDVPGGHQRLEPLNDVRKGELLCLLRLVLFLNDEDAMDMVGHGDERIHLYARVVGRSRLPGLGYHLTGC